MGSLNVTNMVSKEVTVQKININNNNVIHSLQSVSFGSTLFSSYNETTSSDFDDLILTVIYNTTSYSVNLNRGHFFGDNNGAYPGEDYNISIILMGINSSNEIPAMMVYSSTASSTYTSCNDVKNLQPI